VSLKEKDNTLHTQTILTVS